MGNIESGSGHCDFCSDRVARDGAGHAAWTAPARAELGAGDRDHLDARGRKPVVGLDIALVRHRYLGLDGESVIAVVPLLTLGGYRVEPGIDMPELGDAHGVRRC